MNRAVSTTKPRGPTILTAALVVGAVLAAYMVWDSGSVPAVSFSAFKLRQQASSGDEALQKSARASEHKLVELQQQQQATQALIGAVAATVLLPFILACLPGVGVGSSGRTELFLRGSCLHCMLLQSVKIGLMGEHSSVHSPGGCGGLREPPDFSLAH